MRVRADDPQLNEVLTGAGTAGKDPRDGLVFVARTGLREWAETEDELAQAFDMTREAVAAGGAVVYVVRSAALLGRTEPLDAAVAAGLLSGARALALERRKHNGYSTVVAVADDVEPKSVADAVDLLVATRGANGQAFVLGEEHLGAALP
ncbi:hypothetical protein [Rhodococcus koreensis]|uniref:hypothetical protein n=1 Tax=Rhodococcus koreensis TaxID=99653 RepID=UPI00197DE900|nr:hypothetical protein [Rhodococcus koreensis]QSE84651.1 hypothetical protein JWS14_38835 [Rhodococcus koreensis]